MTESAAVVEALLFAARRPLSVEALAAVTGFSEAEVHGQLVDLASGYRERAAGIELVEVAGGYQLRTRGQYAHYIEQLLSPEPQRLSTAALEVLAIVACKQPVTRSEVEAVRGVSSDSALRTLLETGMVEELGRKEAPGRPFLYGTTERFLQEFGLPSLEEFVEKLESGEKTKLGDRQLELFQG